MKKIELTDEEYKKICEFFIENENELSDIGMDQEVYEIACKHFITDDERKAMEDYKKDMEKSK